VKVIMAKDSALIPTLMDGDFPLRPSQSYKLKMAAIIISGHFSQFFFGCFTQYRLAVYLSKFIIYILIM